MKLTLLEAFYIILGALIISFTLYIRVLREVLPTNLATDLFLKEHYIQLVIYFILFVLFLHISILCIKWRLHRHFKQINLNKPNKILNSFGKVGKLWSKSVEQFGLFIINYTFINKKLVKWLQIFGLFCVDKLFNEIKIHCLIVLTHILPKSIFLSAFIVDVMVFHKFEYVYKVSFVMLIPLIESALFYLITTFCKVNLEQTNEIITIHGTTTGKQIIAEEYFFHEFLKKYNKNPGIKSDNYPLNEEDFIVNFREEYKNSAKNFDLTDIIQLLHNYTLPIAEFEFFYKLYREFWLSSYNCVYCLGFASIWLYMLFYCW